MARRCWVAGEFVCQYGAGNTYGTTKLGEIHCSTNLKVCGPGSVGLCCRTVIDGALVRIWKACVHEAIGIKCGGRAFALNDVDTVLAVRLTGWSEAGPRDRDRSSH